MITAKSQIRDGGDQGVGNGDHAVFGGLPVAKWSVFGDDKKHTPDDANGRWSYKRIIAH